MSPNTLAALVVIASVAAWGGFMVFTLMSGSRTKDPGLGVPVPKDPALVGPTNEVAGAAPFIRERQLQEPAPRDRRLEDDLQDISRRQFLNRAWATALLVSLGQFALASIDFLYPRLSGGFGAKITVGDVEEIRNEIAASREPKFIPDGRFFLTLYEGKPEAAKMIPTYKAANVAETGIMALYRKCVHLGCSVPWCPPAKWFECPCHGSKYSFNGEYRDGPAPRSLDQFRVEIVDGKIVVDTSQILQGAPRGTKTSQPQPEGVHCVDIREG